MMKYFIPTYEQCRLICDTHENFIFYETKHVIDGYNISIFNYRLAMPATFYEPVPGTNILAHELRGITFVFNEDGTLYNRYLMLNKFFNLNQYECSSYDKMKKEVIKEIAFKEDGSLLSFIKLPNNKIVAKTKASFEADQAIRSQEIFERNSSINNLVTYCLERDIVPIFEYVSPTNRVVLIYDKTDLVLTKLRNNLTGNYIDINTLPTDILEGVTIVKTFNNLTLDDLIEKCKNDKDYEGFVVTFENEKMIKLKLTHYCDLHGLHTEELYREDYIISLILEESIDDILAQLEDSDERKDMVYDIIKVVENHIERINHNTSELLKKFDGDQKKFFIENKTIKPFIWYALVVINHGQELIEVIKKKILRDTYYLANARKWVAEEKKYMK